MLMLDSYDAGPSTHPTSESDTSLYIRDMNHFVEEWRAGCRTALTGACAPHHGRVLPLS